MSGYVSTVICEDCGWTEDLKRPSTSVKGWHRFFERVTTPAEHNERPIESVRTLGDLCPICAAKRSA
jgi:hypothetical protein